MTKRMLVVSELRRRNDEALEQLLRALDVIDTASSTLTEVENGIYELAGGYRDSDPDEQLLGRAGRRYEGRGSAPRSQRRPRVAQPAQPLERDAAAVGLGRGSRRGRPGRPTSGSYVTIPTVAQRPDLLWPETDGSPTAIQLAPKTQAPTRGN
jgi:hypothetical protein